MYSARLSCLACTENAFVVVVCLVAPIYVCSVGMTDQKILEEINECMVLAAEEELAAKKLAAKELAAKELAAKELAAKELADRD